MPCKRKHLVFCDVLNIVLRIMHITKVKGLGKIGTVFVFVYSVFLFF